MMRRAAVVGIVIWTLALMTVFAQTLPQAW